MTPRDITLSVVSHGQNALVNGLLEDLGRNCADQVALVLTENISDKVPLQHAALACPTEIIANPQVKGFGANHNAAFARCRTPYFCVCNPDIRLPANPFPAMLAALEDGRAGAVGPLVRSPEGRVEDSARRFPTLASLAKKALREDRRPDYPVDQGPQRVDWIAGMFMLFRSDAYRTASGFDEAYFLYYEDVDLCRRLGAAGRTVIYQPAAEVTHAAQRASRRRPALALHHFRSALRFLRT
jgi:N-acetylglucosaminyl-diphospho-decaprenol L-rhamnosyltransferase